jgi:signal transduction histidine kinase/ActR/RegA family two-component response regulator
MERMPTEPKEHRVLVVAPIGKDAELLVREIERSGVRCEISGSIDEMLEEAGRGAAAWIIAEESLPPSFGALADWLGAQPPWSDIPILLLTGTGAGSPTVIEALRLLGNVSLIERPVRVAALLSAVHSAVRARLRQYQTRRHLQDREQANRRKDQFLATLAHELRNPLAPISSCVTLLRRQSTGADLAPICDVLERQSNQLIRLVDDLMDVSRITRGKIALRLQRVDVGEIVGTAIEMVRSQVEAARHRLEVRMGTERLVVEADNVRLCQVLANLLSNACKYTDDGGRIVIEAGRIGDEARIVVKDNGIGIAPDALDGVFELFAQVDAYDVRARGGLGIGLTLARSLVEMHAGSLTARSEGLGRGSSFEVRLPLALPERAVAGAHDQSVPDDLGGRRILVVDDNRDAADSLALLLADLGAQLKVAYDGAGALELAREFRPEVGILDLGMPGMSGYDLARLLRDDGLRPRLLIALSGWGQPHDRDASVAAGFDHHLMKPVDLGELFAHITRVGDGNEARRAQR